MNWFFRSPQSTFLIAYVGAFAVALNCYDFNVARATLVALGWACAAISVHRLIVALGDA